MFLKKERKRTMKKEEIVALGVDGEIAQKIVDMAAGEIDGAYVTKERFNEVNEAKKKAEALVKERDGQIETLKASSGDNETMKKQIEDLQAANKAAADKYAADLKQLRLDNAVDKGITAANGKNAKAIRALLDLEKVEILEDGTAKGLTEQLEALAKAEDSSMLFGSSTPNVKGMVPGKGKETPGSGVDTSKMTYSELAAYMAANPDAKID